MTEAFASKTDGQVVSKAQRWTGLVISGLGTLFLLMDAVMKLLKPAFVVKASVEQLGYPESTIVGIGVALLVSTLLYVIPRTAVLGAILLTAYLGGAVASQVRVGAFSNIAFAIVFACLVWGGLWLRDLRVRNLLAFS